MVERPSAARFAPTRWSLVARARAGDEAGRRALAELCEAYWRPVYAFFRSDGMAPDDARDLTQGLFADLLERDDVTGGDPGKGRFRSYLLACARHYRSNQRDRERAQRRGGDRRHLSIGCRDADGELVAAVEPAVGETPEQTYLRAWVREAVARATAALAEHELAAGRGALFDALRPSLEGEPLDGGYAALARRTGSTEVAVKVAAHRLRSRFRHLLLAELAGTVEHAADAEEELRDLFDALGRGGKPPAPE